MSTNELEEGLIGLFNISMSQRDVLMLMKCFSLDSKGDIMKDEFCEKMVIDPKLWIDRIFIIDKGWFIEFLYEEWLSTIEKQKNTLKDIIQNVIGKAINEVSIVNFNDVLYKINGEAFAGQIGKYYIKNEEDQIKFLSVNTVIDIIMENQVGGYSIHFFKKYVETLFPLVRMSTLQI